MDFNEKGFLGQGISEFRDAVQIRHKEFFDVAAAVNQLAHEVKFELKVHNKDGQEVIAATLFLRILNAFQAVVLLSQYGLLTEAKVVLRNALESLFILKAICKEYSFVHDYVGSDEVRRLRLLNVAHQSKSPLFDEVRQYATPSVIQELKEAIAENGWKELKACDVADKAELKEMYDTHYRLLSEEVHTLPRSMAYLLGKDDVGQVSAFEWGPTEKGIRFVLDIAIHIVLIALVAVANLFEIEKSEAFKVVHGRFETLADQLE